MNAAHVLLATARFDEPTQQALAAIPALATPLGCNPHLSAAVITSILATAGPGELPTLLRAGTDLPRLRAGLDRRYQLLTKLDGEAGEKVYFAVDTALAHSATLAVAAGGAPAHTERLELLATSTHPGPATAQLLLSLADPRCPATPALAAQTDRFVRLAWLSSPAGQLIDDTAAAALLPRVDHDGHHGFDVIVSAIAAVLTQRPALRRGSSADQALTSARELLEHTDNQVAAVPVTRRGRHRALRALKLDRRGWVYHFGTTDHPWLLAALCDRPDLSRRQRRELATLMASYRVAEALGYAAVPAAAKVGADADRSALPDYLYTYAHLLAAALGSLPSAGPPGGVLGKLERNGHLDETTAAEVHAHLLSRLDAAAVTIAELQTWQGAAVANLLQEGMADLCEDERAQCWRTVAVLADTFPGTAGQLLEVARQLL